MNTRKHTLPIRLACLALFALDCALVRAFPSAGTAVVAWLLASFTLALAIAPVQSRFKA